MTSHQLHVLYCIECKITVNSELQKPPWPVQDIRTFAQKRKLHSDLTWQHSAVSQKGKPLCVSQFVCLIWLAGCLGLVLPVKKRAAVYRESECPASSGPVKVTEGSPPLMTRRVTLVVLRFQKGILRLILWLFSHALLSALVTGLWHRMGG
jgi:hypothetical protein